MGKYTKRAQVLFTEDQFQILEARALYEKIPMGELIRSVVEKEIIGEEKMKQKKNAVQELLAGKYDQDFEYDHEKWKKEYGEIKANQALKGLKK